MRKCIPLFLTALILLLLFHRRPEAVQPARIIYDTIVVRDTVRDTGTGSENRVCAPLRHRLPAVARRFGPSRGHGADRAQGVCNAELSRGCGRLLGPSYRNGTVYSKPDHSSRHPEYEALAPAQIRK